MNYKPLVSIVIPVFNGASFLNEAIDSALNQTYQNIEIIVVNDGSKDEGKTEAIAKSYGDKIRYFTKENGGCGTALNLAIREMKGDFFSWLSHDDIYLPNKIEWQLECHMQLANKDSIIFGSFNLIDEEGKFLAASMLHKHSSIDKLNTPLYPLLNGLIHGCSLLIPSHLFKKFGVFNEEKRTTQDYDLWFRFSRQVPLVYDHETLIKWRIHPNQDTQKLNTLHLKECNELWSGFILELSAIEKSNLYGSEYLFLKRMAEHLGITPYSEASKLATLMFHEYVNSVKVSVIIPLNKNLISSLLSIESVQNQSHSNVEILVVGYGEDSNIANLAIITKSDQRIKLIETKCATASEALNFGIKSASGSLITFIFKDTIYSKDKIERQLTAMLENTSSFSICQKFDCDIDLKPLDTIATNSDDVKKFTPSDILLLASSCLSTIMIDSSIASRIKFDESIDDSSYPVQLIEMSQYGSPLMLQSALVATKILISNNETTLDSLAKNIFLKSQTLITLSSKKFWQNLSLNATHDHRFDLLNLTNKRLDSIFLEVVDTINPTISQNDTRNYNETFNIENVTISNRINFAINKIRLSPRLIKERYKKINASVSYADIEGYIVSSIKPMLTTIVYKKLKNFYHRLKKTIVNKQDE